MSRQLVKQCLPLCVYSTYSFLDACWHHSLALPVVAIKLRQITTCRVSDIYMYNVWKAVVDVPCNLQHVVIILQRVEGYMVCPQRPSIIMYSWGCHRKLDEAIGERRNNKLLTSL